VKPGDACHQLHESARRGSTGTLSRWSRAGTGAVRIKEFSFCYGLDLVRRLCMPAQYRGPHGLRTGGSGVAEWPSKETASDSLGALTSTGIDEEI
jgi:hypothetical protein